MRCTLPATAVRPLTRGDAEVQGWPYPQAHAWPHERVTLSPGGDRTLTEMNMLAAELRSATITFFFDQMEPSFFLFQFLERTLCLTVSLNSEKACL